MMTKVIILFLLTTSFLPAETFASLQDEVTAEVATPLPITALELQKAQSTQFIFVDGICGDFFKSNFAPAVAFLADEWGASDVAVIRPSTATPMTDNAEILYSEISKLRASSENKNAVLTAHSKGAAEVLMMVLRHPDLISQMGISTFALVSGAIGGTNVARVISVCDGFNPLCQFLNTIVPSLNGLLPENVTPVYQEDLKRLTDFEKQAILPHLYYVRTQMSDTDLTSPLLVPHLYMNESGSGPNDGLIPTENERLLNDGSVFGTDLGVMQGDHNSLLNNSFLPNLLKYRKSFFKVLMQNSLFN